MDVEKEMIVKRLNVPLGLEELMESLTKEVLHKKPNDVYLFASEHFAQLLAFRDGCHKNRRAKKSPMLTKTIEDCMRRRSSIKIKSATIGMTVPNIIVKAPTLSSYVTISKKTQNQRPDKTKSILDKRKSKKNLDNGKHLEIVPGQTIKSEVIRSYSKNLKSQIADDLKRGMKSDVNKIPSLKIIETGKSVGIIKRDINEKSLIGITTNDSNISKNNNNELNDAEDINIGDSGGTLLDNQIIISGAPEQANNGILIKGEQRNLNGIMKKLEVAILKNTNTSNRFTLDIESNQLEIDRAHMQSVNKLNNIENNKEKQEPKSTNIGDILSADHFSIVSRTNGNNSDDCTIISTDRVKDTNEPNILNEETLLNKLNEGEVSKMTDDQHILCINEQTSEEISNVQSNIKTEEKSTGNPETQAETDDDVYFRNQKVVAEGKSAELQKLDEKQYNDDTSLLEEQSNEVEVHTDPETEAPKIEVELKTRNVHVEEYKSHIKSQCDATINEEDDIGKEDQNLEGKWNIDSNRNMLMKVEDIPNEESGNELKDVTEKYEESRKPELECLTDNQKEYYSDLENLMEEKAIEVDIVVESKNTDSTKENLEDVPHSTHENISDPEPNDIKPDSQPNERDTKHNVIDGSQKYITTDKQEHSEIQNQLYVKQEEIDVSDVKELTVFVDGFVTSDTYPDLNESQTLEAIGNIKMFKNKDERVTQSTETEILRITEVEGGAKCKNELDQNSTQLDEIVPECKYGNNGVEEKVNSISSIEEDDGVSYQTQDLKDISKKDAPSTLDQMYTRTIEEHEGTKVEEVRGKRKTLDIDVENTESVDVANIVFAEKEELRTLINCEEMGKENNQRTIELIDKHNFNLNMSGEANDHDRIDGLNFEESTKQLPVTTTLEKEENGIYEEAQHITVTYEDVKLTTKSKSGEYECEIQQEIKSTFNEEEREKLSQEIQTPINIYSNNDLEVEDKTKIISSEKQVEIREGGEIILKDEIGNDTVEAAAIKIQAAVRRYLVWKKLKNTVGREITGQNVNSEMFKDPMETIILNPNVISAALKIQYLWRTYKIRQTLKESHLKTSLARRECDELPEHRGLLSNKDVVKATTVIQALFRGYIVRKQYQYLQKRKNKGFIEKMLTLTEDEENLLEENDETNVVVLTQPISYNKQSTEDKSLARCLTEVETPLEYTFLSQLTRSVSVPNYGDYFQVEDLDSFPKSKKGTTYTSMMNLTESIEDLSNINDAKYTTERVLPKVGEVVGEEVKANAIEVPHRDVIESWEDNQAISNVNKRNLLEQVAETKILDEFINNSKKVDEHLETGKETFELHVVNQIDLGILGYQSEEKYVKCKESNNSEASTFTQGKSPSIVEIDKANEHENRNIIQKLHTVENYEGNKIEESTIQELERKNVDKTSTPVGYLVDNGDNYETDGIIDHKTRNYLNNGNSEGNIARKSDNLIAIDESNLKIVEDNIAEGNQNMQICNKKGGIINGQKENEEVVHAEHRREETIEFKENDNKNKENENLRVIDTKMLEETSERDDNESEQNAGHANDSPKYENENTTLVNKLKLIREEHEMEDNNIIKIDKKNVETNAIPSTQTSIDEIPEDYFNAAVAATTIQKVYKGYRVRRDLKKENANDVRSISTGNTKAVGDILTNFVKDSDNEEVATDKKLPDYKIVEERVIINEFNNGVSHGFTEIMEDSAADNNIGQDGKTKEHIAFKGTSNNGSTSNSVIGDGLIITDQEKAATTIQKKFKGYLVRKYLQKQNASGNIENRENIHTYDLDERNMIAKIENKRDISQSQTNGNKEITEGSGEILRETVAAKSENKMDTSQTNANMEITGESEKILLENLIQDSRRNSECKENVRNTIISEDICYEGTRDTTQTQSNGNNEIVDESEKILIDNQIQGSRRDRQSKENLGNTVISEDIFHESIRDTSQIQNNVTKEITEESEKILIDKPILDLRRDSEGKVNVVNAIIREHIYHEDTRATSQAQANENKDITEESKETLIENPIQDFKTIGNSEGKENMGNAIIGEDIFNQSIGDISEKENNDNEVIIKGYEKILIDNQNQNLRSNSKSKEKVGNAITSEDICHEGTSDLDERNMAAANDNKGDIAQAQTNDNKEITEGSEEMLIENSTQDLGRNSESTDNEGCTITDVSDEGNNEATNNNVRSMVAKSENKRYTSQTQTHTNKEITEVSEKIMLGNPSQALRKNSGSKETVGNPIISEDECYNAKLHPENNAIDNISLGGKNDCFVEEENAVKEHEVVGEILVEGEESQDTSFISQLSDDVHIKDLVLPIKLDLQNLKQTLCKGLPLEATNEETENDHVTHLAKSIKNGVMKLQETLLDNFSTNEAKSIIPFECTTSDKSQTPDAEGARKNSACEISTPNDLQGDFLNKASLHIPDACIETNLIKQAGTDNAKQIEQSNNNKQINIETGGKAVNNDLNADSCNKYSNDPIPCDLVMFEKFSRPVSKESTISNESMDTVIFINHTRIDNETKAECKSLNEDNLKNQVIEFETNNLDVTPGMEQNVSTISDDRSNIHEPNEDLNSKITNYHDSTFDNNTKIYEKINTAPSNCLVEDNTLSKDEMTDRQGAQSEQINKIENGEKVAFVDNNECKNISDKQEEVIDKNTIQNETNVIELTNLSKSGKNDERSKESVRGENQSEAATITNAGNQALDKKMSSIDTEITQYLKTVTEPIRIAFSTDKIPSKDTHETHLPSLKTEEITNQKSIYVPLRDYSTEELSTKDCDETGDAFIIQKEESIDGTNIVNAANRLIRLSDIGLVSNLEQSQIHTNRQNYREEMLGAVALENEKINDRNGNRGVDSLTVIDHEEKKIVNEESTEMTDENRRGNTNTLDTKIEKSIENIDKEITTYLNSIIEPIKQAFSTNNSQKVSDDVPKSEVSYNEEPNYVYIPLKNYDDREVHDINLTQLDNIKETNSKHVKQSLQYANEERNLEISGNSREPDPILTAKITDISAGYQDDMKKQLFIPPEKEMRGPGQTASNREYFDSNIEEKNMQINIVAVSGNNSEKLEIKSLEEMAEHQSEDGSHVIHLVNDTSKEEITKDGNFDKTNLNEGETLLNSSEFHDGVLANQQGQSVVEAAPQERSSATSTVGLHSGELHDSILPIVLHLNDAPAGVENMTSTKLANDGAQAFRKVESARTSTSEASQIDRNHEMDVEKRNNCTIVKKKNMEIEAATKIQAGFRGYQVRKQLKDRNSFGPTSNIRRSTRRKSSGRISENIKNIQKKNTSQLEEQSATKIQASIRGFLVRRRQMKNKDTIYDSV